MAQTLTTYKFSMIKSQMNLKTKGKKNRRNNIFELVLNKYATIQVCCLSIILCLIITIPAEQILLSRCRRKDTGGAERNY